jgi:hypothetical protein
MNLCRTHRDMASCSGVRTVGVHVLSSLLECEHSIPITFHIDDCPSFEISRIECLVLFSNMRATVVGSFAFGIGMMDETHETRSWPSSRPLQPLVISV